MAQFKEIKATELAGNPFKLIGEDWMLIAAGSEEKFNMMTASWGGLGVMWGRNVAFIVVRPTRFTKEFIDAGSHFSLSFFGGAFKKELTFCGRNSGRNVDKLGGTGFTAAFDKAPYFEEAKTVLICKKLFAQPYEEASILDASVFKEYPLKDYHTLYIAEIEKVLVK